MKTPLKASILIAEDNLKESLLLKELLENQGFQVTLAKSGKEAIEKLKSREFDLVLADYKLPDIDGIQVLKKAQELRPTAKRALITAYPDKEALIASVNVGQISSFIPKPWDNDMLLEIIRQAVEKGALEKEMLQMQELVFENHKELAKAHKNLKSQLEIGKKIHKTLLLGKIPEKLPGLSVGIKAAPSNEIDGDFFEFYRPLPHIVDICLGDVMGKGITAALVGTAVKTQLARFALPLSVPYIFDRKSWWQESLLSPEAIISKLFESINKELLELEYFVSLIFARLDLRKRVLRWVDLGFNKPIHFSAEDKRARFLKSEGYPLGMVERGVFKSQETAFQENDFFVFYSDGLIQAKSHKDELFGTERIIKLIEQSHHLQPEALSLKIKDEIIKFQGKEKFDDDLFIIVLKIDKYFEIDPSIRGKAQFRADMTQLKAVREFVERASKDVPGNYDAITYDLKLAINEVFCNIVKHGYKNEIEKPIRIIIEPDVHGVKVDISDKGDPFDPHMIGEPSLFGDKDDGYGWYLIRQLVDKVIYAPKSLKDGWNHLSIYKTYCYEEDRMEIIHAAEKDLLVITPMGDSLDAKETPEFKEAVLKLIDDNESKYVIFDLKELQFIDSSGLGSFLSILRRLNADGGDLKLCHMNKSVQSMFELVSMHKIFDILSSVEEAKKARASQKAL
ncbi:MAG: anti-sigma factor antagonist [Chlamydiia bacterium]|nr:anti-sigma factor antagonist [Chlamydiia bacterium]